MLTSSVAFDSVFLTHRNMIWICKWSFITTSSKKDTFKCLICILILKINTKRAILNTSYHYVQETSTSWTPRDAFPFRICLIWPSTSMWKFPCLGANIYVNFYMTLPARSSYSCRIWEVVSCNPYKKSHLQTDQLTMGAAFMQRCSTA